VPLREATRNSADDALSTAALTTLVVLMNDNIPSLVAGRHGTTTSSDSFVHQSTVQSAQWDSFVPLHASAVRFRREIFFVIYLDYQET
jgi:hypothetical protein